MSLLWTSTMQREFCLRCAQAPQATYKNSYQWKTSITWTSCSQFNDTFYHNSNCDKRKKKIMKTYCHCFNTRRGAYIIAIIGIILGITGLVASSISKAEFIRVSVCFSHSHLHIQQCSCKKMWVTPHQENFECSNLGPISLLRTKRILSDAEKIRNFKIRHWTWVIIKLIT